MGFKTAYAASETAALQNYKSEMIDDKIPMGAIEYAHENFKDVLYSSFGYYEQLSSKNPENYSLGDPFVICTLDGVQEEIYYFPICIGNKIVLVMSIVGTNQGYTLSASDELVALLERNNYIQNSFLLFYEEDEIIKVKTFFDTSLVTNTTISPQDSNVARDFDEASWITCVQYISTRITSMKTVNFEERSNNRMSKEAIIEAYTPAFSTDNVNGLKGSRICALYNPQRQYNLPICWAASVATIVNYRLGTNYSAIDVCDRMESEYVGKTVSFMKDSLKKYGITYNISYSQMNLGVIRAKIDNKYPISMISSNADGGWHATTLYGYTIATNGNYIVMHNPGTGSCSTIQYNTSGTTYSYNNKTFTWLQSLHY